MSDAYARLLQNEDYFPGCGFVRADLIFSPGTLIYFASSADPDEPLHCAPVDLALQDFPHLVSLTPCDEYTRGWMHYYWSDFPPFVEFLPINAARLGLLRLTVR